ncbi:hypothetical protein [Xanthobacter tagetidis]|nr:hypothetical protein [Xanthobacter tagetidis]MBB6308902.1 hypothetical protein [Xanthobacter tagetidis]
MADAMNGGAENAPISSADMEAEDAAFVRDLWGIGQVDPADLHPFPMDRGRSLEAARSAGFASTAPVEGEGEVPAAPEDTGEDPTPVPSAPEIAYLVPPKREVTLDHPFRYGDREVRAIAIPEPHLGLKLDLVAGLLPSAFDLAWALTSEPADLLRALRGKDGERVLKAAVDALPPELRKAYR